MPVVTEAQEAWQVRADKIRAKARQHKKLSNHHRRRAREAMQEYAALLASHGIKLQEAKADSHGRSNQPITY